MLNIFLFINIPNEFKCIIISTLENQISWSLILVDEQQQHYLKQRYEDGNAEDDSPPTDNLGASRRHKKSQYVSYNKACDDEKLVEGS